MSIILVRHGETALNATRVLQFPETPLGERGLAQARAVGQRLRSPRPAAILASDMARAWMTAEAIAATTGLPIRPTRLLHERNFGDLRGKSYDGLGYDPIHSDDAAPNGESMAQFRARVLAAFEEARALRATLDGDLVVVSHGLVIKLILSELVPRADGKPAPERLGNTSVSILDAQAPYTARLIDCTAHLESGIADNKATVAGV